MVEQTIKVDRAKLREAIQLEYQDVAATPDKGFHFIVGRPLAERLDYPMDEVDQLPPSVVESFAGVGNPFALGPLNRGDVVADLGSGAGLDSILAMRQVGPTGRVIGVDMTDEMLDKSRANVAATGHTQIEFRKGYLEELPIADESVDVVISNGVFNLLPDKRKAFDEAYRVLKPGGRMQVSDIIVEKEVPEDARNDIDLWTGWIAGALLEAALEQVIRSAGFDNVTFSTQRYNTFADAPQESSAANFGTQGVNFTAIKPAR